MDLFTNTIEGLYVAFYHRAADQEGLDYWLQRADESTNGDYMYELAAGFAQNSQFEAEYGSLDDENFVKAVYQNVLNGVDDDANAIAYWEDRVDAVGRDGMVAEFVKAVLEYDGDDAEGIARQEFFQNRVDVAKSFTETLAEESNPVNFDHLDQDSAYLASQAVIESVVDDASLESVLAFIEDHDTLDTWGDEFLTAHTGGEAGAQEEEGNAEEAAGGYMHGLGGMMGGTEGNTGDEEAGTQEEEGNTEAADAQEEEGNAEEAAGGYMHGISGMMGDTEGNTGDEEAGTQEESNTEASGEDGTTTDTSADDGSMNYDNLANTDNNAGSEETYSYSNDSDTTTSSYTEEDQHTSEENDTASLAGVEESHVHDSSAFGF